MIKKLKFLGQLALLSFIYFLGNRIALGTGLPVPGNVAGVVLLFGLLWFRVIRLEWVQDAADFLIRHLLFLFLPFVVDLMNWGRFFYSYGFRLALAIGVSTLLAFLVTGSVVQLLQRGRA